MSGIQAHIEKSRQEGKKLLAVLIDPDKVRPEDLAEMAENMKHSAVDLILVGGSLMVHDHFGSTIRTLKELSSLPVVIFPGHPMQVSSSADAILLLSLISGRNPELLIGQHVHAAPVLRKSGLEIMPTGYMLVDGEMPTTVSYMSNTQPIPRDKAEIAACTALAGEMLGLKNIYLEAGSGAVSPVPHEMIRAVRENISVPLIVGGGIRDPFSAHEASRAGADIVVVGSALEKDQSIMFELAEAIHSA